MKFISSGLIFGILMPILLNAQNPGFTAPDTPTIYATVEHGRIIVSWDNLAQKSIDALTGYADFEGYRIYRSKDRGVTWGGPNDKLYNYNGEFVGWKPYVQFDLSLDADIKHCIYSFGDCGTGAKRGIGISGPDPFNPRISLGTNSGLENSFIDENVFDGIEYTYTITAYDIGIKTFTIEYSDPDGDGVFSADTVWSPTNPDHFAGPGGGGYPSLESPFGTSPADRNFITVIPGYLASNISFPDQSDVTSFLRPVAGNIGNGDISYFVVDKEDLSNNILKFEVQASKTNTSVEGMACVNPFIYVYAVDDTIAQNPVDVAYFNSVDYTEAQIDSLIDLPGALQSGDQIGIPNYIAMFKPTDGPSNIWSEVFEGIRVKYENLPNAIVKLPADFSPIKKLEWHADSTVIKTVNIELDYQSSNAYTLKPNFDYKIEFSSTVLDTPISSVPPAGCIGHGIPKAELPFRVTNLTTGKVVNVSHIDKGIYQSPDPTHPDPGYLDCTWTRNELIKFDQDSILINTTLTSSKTYTMNLDIEFSLAYPLLDTVWLPGILYKQGDRVYHEGMVWRVSEDLTGTIEPIAYFDDDGDQINDNPWKPVYPWKNGDYVIVRTKKFFVDGDSWVADMSLLGQTHEVTQDNLKEISVVPNPYIVHSKFNETSTSRRLRFTHLPQECRIQIFTITGEIVATLVHSDEFDGNAWWDLRTENNQEVSPGLYIYVVESGSQKHIGKFAVVR